MDYTAKRIHIPVGKKVKVDAMVILPRLKNDEEETEKIKMARLSALDKKFEDQNEASMMSDRSFNGDSFANSLNHEDTIEYQAGPVVIFFQPNGMFYENYCHDTQFLEFYTSRGVTVVVWNYRGFGRSPGKCTLNNVVKDGMKVVQYIKFHLQPSHLILHGRSFGGYVVQQLAPHCDLAILDSTFSKISFIAREKVNRYA